MLMLAAVPLGAAASTGVDGDGPASSRIAATATDDTPRQSDEGSSEQPLDAQDVVVLGTDALANGYRSVAIGSKSAAWSNFGVALGPQSSAEAVGAVAIGALSSAQA